MSGIVLEHDEQIVHVQTTWALARLPGVCCALAFLIAPFFFFFPLFGLGWPGKTVFFLSFLTGGWMLIRQMVRFERHRLVLTTARVICLPWKGLGETRALAAPLLAIADVSYRTQGFFGALCDAGVVRIRFHGVLPSMQFGLVRHPERVHDLVQEIARLPSIAIADTPTEFERHHVDLL